MLHFLTRTHSQISSLAPYTQTIPGSSRRRRQCPLLAGPRNPNPCAAACVCALAFLLRHTHTCKPAAAHAHTLSAAHSRTHTHRVHAHTHTRVASARTHTHTHSRRPADDATGDSESRDERASARAFWFESAPRRRHGSFAHTCPTYTHTHTHTHSRGQCGARRRARMFCSRACDRLACIDKRARAEMRVRSCVPRRTMLLIGWK